MSKGAERLSRKVKRVEWLVSPSPMIRTTVLLSILIVVTPFLALPLFILYPLGQQQKLFGPTARLWSRLVLLLSGVRVEARGLDWVGTERPVIFMANHQSYFDIPALYSIIRQPMVAIGKKSLFHIPVFGWVLRLMEFVQIDRSDRESAIRSLQDAGQLLCRGNVSLLTFPEGTRSKDGRLLPFKKGVFILALRSEIPLIPVSIRGTHRVLPRGRKAIRPGTISVVFGEPIETANFTLEEKERVMEMVRGEIQRGLA